jgi:hypothetical protein
LIFFIYGCLLGLNYAWSHEGAHKKTANTQQEVNRKIDATAYQEINSNYLADIKPIFKKACFDCHSSQTNYPWYAHIPFVQSMIKHDVTEAKKHLNMDTDFPFESHGSPEEDLESIKASVQDGSMPPRMYSILHDSSQLSETEKENVKNWVEQSLKRLKK